MDFYVYLHRKKTTGEVFYVGKGSGDRAWNRQGRNEFWKKTVRKHGYYVEIHSHGLQEWYAFELERDLICYYGRRQLGLGTLVNLSDGGEGPSGQVFSEDFKKQCSIRTKGKSNPNVDHRVWKFLNVKTEEIVEATKYEMSQMYPELSIGALFSKTYTHKGWAVMGLASEHSISILQKGRGGSRNANANKTSFNWINIITKEEITCTPSELREKFPHTRPNNVVTNKHPFTKDWTLKEIYETVPTEHLLYPRKGDKAGNLDAHVYTFENTVTCEIFIGRRMDFCNKFSININDLFRKTRKRKTVKNWKLVN